jgi:inositol-polyphosphate multikinase
MNTARVLRPVFASCAAGFTSSSLLSEKYDDLDGLGGHGGLLRTPHGTILKPIAPNRCGAWERQFYETLAAVCPSTTRDSLEMYCNRAPRRVAVAGNALFVVWQRWVLSSLRFYGVRTLSGLTGEQAYLELEDITKGMQHPCVMDVKLGTKSFDEDASPEKAAREASKWPLQSTLGFRFTGMHVQWRNCRDCEGDGEWLQLRVGTGFGYTLTPASFVGALATFAGHRSCADEPHVQYTLHVLLRLVSELDEILRQAKRQHAVRVYGGSLLAAYDAADPHDVRVMVIDYGHVWPILDTNGVDAGLITGLETLQLYVAAALCVVAYPDLH